jgi:hypothetical protein
MSTFRISPQYDAGYAAGKSEQREADAALVEAAGCVCFQLHQGWLHEQEWPGPYEFTWAGSIVADRVEVHDPRCPISLAEQTRRQA